MYKFIYYKFAYLCFIQYKKKKYESNTLSYLY